MDPRIYSIDEIIFKLMPVFRSHSVRQAILFGSYAKNCATSQSDVDILVDSGLHGLAFYGLLEDVVESLDKSVDLIDVSQLEPGSQIQRDIQQEGRIIYERKRQASA